MKDLFEAIKRFGKFSEEELRSIAEVAQEKTLTAGELLLRKGEVCSSLHFLKSGSLIESRTNDDGELVVRNLFVPGDWVMDHKSFTSREPADHAISANADGHLSSLHMEDIHALIGKSPTFFQLGSILQLGTARQEFFDKYDSPDQRYAFLLNNRAELLQRFPLKIIAAYLRMTPETLSRVRKRQAKR